MLLRLSMACLKSKLLMLIFSGRGRSMTGLDVSYSRSNGGWGTLLDWSDLSRYGNFVFSINSEPVEFIDSSPFSIIVIGYIWTCIRIADQIICESIKRNPMNSERIRNNWFKSAQSASYYSGF